MEDVDVSIIFVNYHTSQLIADCISSIHKQSNGFSYEIIIVDNNTEPTLKEIYSMVPNCKVICLPENVGFGRANNAGFKVSRGRYLLCLNPDTLLLNNAIGELLEFMESHSDACACGGNLYGPDLNPTLSFRRIVPGFKWEISQLLNLMPEKKKYGQDRVFNNSNVQMEVGYITGADLLLRRDVLEKIGGFDARFFMYYEETDLCARILSTGGKIYSVPEAKIQHLEGGSFDDEKGKINFARIERSERGRRTYYKIHFTFIKRALLNAIYLLTLISRAVLLPDSPKRDSWRYKLKLFFKRHL